MGWSGGLLSILLALQTFLVAPFVTDQLSYKVAANSIEGKLAHVHTTKFYVQNILYNLICCEGMSKWLLGPKYVDGRSIMEKYEELLQEKMEVFDVSNFKDN